MPDPRSERSDELVRHGWDDRWAALLGVAAIPGAEPGRVVRHDGVALTVARRRGIGRVGIARSIDPAPTIGDWVAVAHEAAVAVLPRTTLLTRRSAHGDAPQALAANVDGVLVVCGLDRPVRSGRIDRFVTLAWDAGATPIVVLTKADLVGDAAAVAAGVAAAHPGIDVVAASVTTPGGTGAVAAIAAGRTVVLVGESGAGKSSLANALLGGEVMATGAVRSGDFKGRHVTTTREAHPLPAGGVLIDTPGLRAVGLSADPDAVAATYADVEQLATGCRFSDCAHESEPGCAVKAAVETGDLAPARLAGWRALEREAAAAELRANPRLLRDRNRRFGRMVRDAQRHKDRDR